MLIEKIHIKNFKALENVTLDHLPAMSVFVGKNGVGKTTLFRVFAFLQECLRTNVSVALQKEGGLLGFKEVITRGKNIEKETIQIDMQFRLEIANKLRLVTYILEIGLKEHKPVVKREILRYKRDKNGKPFHFIEFKNGQGNAVSNEADFNKKDIELTREHQTLGSPDILAIKGLGQFDRFKAAKAFRELIENWHISDIHINRARGAKLPDEGNHVSTHGDNLPSVAQKMMQNHPEIFETVIQKMRDRVPGVTNIEAKQMEDGSLVLRYRDGSFIDPFFDKNVSDGTIKMFAYLLLLHDPKPHKILCIEEPENQLYPELMTILAEEFTEYTRSGGQVFISTHSPDFINSVGIESLFMLEKNLGVTSFLRMKNDPSVSDLFQKGDKLGYLWEKGFFTGASHRISAPKK